VGQYNRSNRVGEQMLRDISSFFARELSDKIPGMITFTHVKLSADLQNATVYYSYLGQESEEGFAQTFLDREKKRIRHEVGRDMQLRRIPELTFKFDPSIEEGIRIEQLLNEIKNEPEEH
jgi:ribosome-binding factor A